MIPVPIHHHAFNCTKCAIFVENSRHVYIYASSTILFLHNVYLWLLPET